MPWWRGRRAGGQQRVFAALARRDGQFSRPVALSGPGDEGPTAALGPRGDALVVWPHDARSLHAVMSYSGRPFGRRRRVGAAASRNEVSAAVGADGAAAIVWVSQPYESGDGGGPLGPAQLRVAYARPRSHFESAARPAKDLSIRSPHVAFDSNRNAVFVWRGANAIRAGEIRAGSVGLLPDIVPAGSEPVEIEALAAGPRRGRALVLWTAGDTSFTADPTYLRAAYRPDIASPFGPQEAVAPTAEDPYDAFAALDPVTGEATAVWARERGGTSGRLVEASVRR